MSTARLRLASLVLASGTAIVAAVLPSAAHASVGDDVPTAGAAAAAAAPASASTERVLPRRLPGARALAAVQPRLAEVAKKNGVSAAHLSDVLAHDHTAWLSTEGRLFYQEDAVEESTTTPQTAEATVAPSYPLAQTFALHSRPGSAKTIFLDFDGATVSGTSWNTSKNGSMADGTYTGFDLDGNPASFSDSEKAYVQEVWRQVSESYSPFDVDVTTQDPGTAAIVRSSTSDQSYGTKVLITSQASARSQACGGCLGVAYVGTFDAIDPTGSYQPAWVFSYSTSFDPMIVAQAATHETGHTLGLSHDGTSSASYYAGTSAWGPVMGSSMNRAVTQFSKGEYTGANNTQDDFAVMQSNGLALRADDHGDTPASADQLGQQASYAAAGVISTRSDTDVFAVSLPCTTTLTASANGIGAQTALDLQLQVLDAGGTVLATSSPASTYSGSPPRSAGMDASLSVANASGTYYLKVDGVGNGNPAQGGWSDYGSLGQYTLRVSGCTSTSAPATPSTPSPTPTSPTPTSPAPTTPPTTSGPTSPPTTPPPTTTPRRPSAPRIGGASSGTRGGPRTAVVRWSAPADPGTASISGYQIRAYKLGRHSRVVSTYTTGRVHAGARAATLYLPRGRYSFRVLALSPVGSSPWSATSWSVTAR